MQKERIVKVNPIFALILLPIQTNILTTLHGVKRQPVLLIRPNLIRHISGDEKFPQNSLTSRLIFETEIALRKYGITSCHPLKQFSFQNNDGSVGNYQDREIKVDGIKDYIKNGIIDITDRFDVANIQMGYSEHNNLPYLVDLEHYNYRNSFGNHLAQISFNNSTDTMDVIPRLSIKTNNISSLSNELRQLIRPTNVDLNELGFSTEEKMEQTQLYCKAIKYSDDFNNLRNLIMDLESLIAKGF